MNQLAPILNSGLEFNVAIGEEAVNGASAT